MPISVPGTGNTPQCGVTPANTVIYVANGTFVVPPGVQSLTFAYVGGGAGGSGGPHTALTSIYNGFGGLASVGFLNTVIAVTDTQYSIVIGTGGAGGNNAAGTAGGATTVSTVSVPTIVLSSAGGLPGPTGSYDGVNYYPLGTANGGPGNSSVFGLGSIAVPAGFGCASFIYQPGSWGAGGGGSPAKGNCSSIGLNGLDGTQGYVQISWNNP